MKLIVQNIAFSRFYRFTVVFPTLYGRFSFWKISRWG